MTEAQVKALTPKDEIAVLLTELEKQFPAVQAAPEAPQVPPLVPPVAAPYVFVLPPKTAALAIEHGAHLCSSDNDFRRFPGLMWLNPLA